MRLLRELSRRKLRTTLTILGITIGIWALVVFSSMANKINALVEGGSQYYAHKIIVSDASNIGVGLGVAPMDIAVADQIRGLDDVAAVDPQVQMLFDETLEGGAAFGLPKLIIGGVAGADEGLEDFVLGRITRWALCTSRSQTALAIVPSPMTECHSLGSSWLVTVMELVP